MLGIFQIPAALPTGLTLAVKDSAGTLVPAADLFTDEPRTVPFAANPTTLAAGGQFWFYTAADGNYQVVLGGTASAADLSWNGGVAKTFPAAPVVRPLAAATQLQAETSNGTTLLSWTAQRIHQAIAYALGLWKSIAGQRDIRTDLTATNGGTVTLDCALGNAFIIDASALSAGNSFTVALNNVPAGSVFFSAEVAVVVGADIPTISYTNKGTNVSAPSLTASRTNIIIVSTWNNGTTLMLNSGGAY